MNEDQHIHELIDQYLEGKLIGEELDLFRIRLREDKDFLHQVQVQKALIAEIELMRETQLREVFGKRKKKKAFVIPLSKRVLSVAAVILSITALGMILKMFLPLEQMAMDTPEVPETEVVEELNESEPTEELIDTTSEIVDANSVNDELVEVVEDDEDVPEAEKPAEIATLNNETDDLGNLKEEEDKLKAEDIDAKKDELISSRTISVLAYQKVIPAIESREVKTTSTEVLSKKEARKLKKDAKNTVDEVDAPADTAPVTEQITSSFGKSINVQYWKSIVNFKGYNYNGSTLKLYDVSSDEAISIVSFAGVTYLKRSGSVYSLKSNGAYEPFAKVSNEEVLKVINK